MSVTAPLLDRRRAGAGVAPSTPPSAPDGRPDLRVLRPGEAAADADRRRLVRLLVVVAAVVVALCVFGVVVFHVVLTQNQFRLDALQDQALEREAEYDRLRLQVAELESPDRVVADAQQRLGMITPPKITYLAPTIEEPGEAADGASRSPAGAPGATAAGEGWSVVKPHLADG